MSVTANALATEIVRELGWTRADSDRQLLNPEELLGRLQLADPVIDEHSAFAGSRLQVNTWLASRCSSPWRKPPARVTRRCVRVYSAANALERACGALSWMLR